MEAAEIEIKLTQEFNAALDHYDADELRECVAKVDALLADPELPIGHRIKALVLLASIHEDWEEANRFLDEAEKLWRVARRAFPQDENDFDNGIILQLRESLDHLRKELTDHGPRDFGVKTTDMSEYIELVKEEYAASEGTEISQPCYAFPPDHVNTTDEPGFRESVEREVREQLEKSLNIDLKQYIQTEIEKEVRDQLQKILARDLMPFLHKEIQNDVREKVEMNMNFVVKPYVQNEVHLQSHKELDNRSQGVSREIARSIDAQLQIQLQGHIHKRIDEIIQSKFGNKLHWTIKKKVRREMQQNYDY